MVMQARTTDSHPTYTVLSLAIKQYPHAASAIFQTYNDLFLGGSGTAVHPVDWYSSYVAQRWTEFEVVDLPKCGRCGFRDNRPEKRNAGMCVVPCLLAETISMDWLKSAFDELDNPGELFLAICAEDSSTVYYRLSIGINKPPV
ncbi:hypothetical protein BJV74DRAFT_980913 [Russula compacta]|nr:hypothetical protein BJV74DRAFT_980913 [Russula compacta]